MTPEFPDWIESAKAIDISAILAKRGIQAARARRQARRAMPDLRRGGKMASAALQRGQVYAVCVSVAHRLNFARPVIVHGGYANGGGSAHIGRVGFGVEF